MIRVLKYGLSALAKASASVASAADDKTRFESSGFLKSLDLLISEQLEKQRKQTGKADADKLKGLDLSLGETDLQRRQPGECGTATGVC